VLGYTEIGRVEARQKMGFDASRRYEFIPAFQGPRKFNDFGVRRQSQRDAALDCLLKRTRFHPKRRRAALAAALQRVARLFN